MRLRAFLPGAAPLAAALLAACVHSGEERQLDVMRDDIDRLQSSRDRADEVMIPPDPADHSPSSVPPRQPAPAMTPSLNAVSLGAEAGQPANDYADTEDTTPRPTLRVFGTSRRGRSREDVVEETLPDEAAASQAQPPRPSALDPAAKRAYDAALSMVTARQYGPALDSLAAFIIKWPDHPYADNAMYWRGECYFARGEYLSASEQFEGVLARFPAGNKVPDALLKLGITSQKLGNPVKAKEYFDRLAQQYPQTEAARRIPSISVPAPAPSGPASQDHR